MHRSRADDSAVTQMCVGFPTAVRTASGSKGWISPSQPLSGHPQLKLQNINSCCLAALQAPCKENRWTKPKEGPGVRRTTPSFWKRHLQGKNPLCRTAVKRSRARPDVTRLSRHGCPQEAAPSRRVRPLFYRIDPTVPIRYNQRRYHPLDGLLIFRLHLANPLSPQPLKQTR